MITFTDPKAFELFADETRRRIVFMLRAKEMTVSQIAGDFQLTPQAVYHHIKKLVKGGMVEVTKEVRVGHLIESYYRATAEAFHFMAGKTSHSKKAAREQVASALDAMGRIGFKLEYDSDTIAELADLEIELAKCCKKAEYEEAISELDNTDFLSQLLAEEYIGIVSVSDKDMAKEDEVQKKIRDMLKSVVKGRPRAPSKKKTKKSKKSKK